jgi:hypothetical protein
MGFLLGGFEEWQKHAARHLPPVVVVLLEVAEEGILLQLQVVTAWEGVGVVSAVEDKLVCEK